MKRLPIGKNIVVRFIQNRSVALKPIVNGLMERTTRLRSKIPGQASALALQSLCAVAVAGTADTKVLEKIKETLNGFAQDSNRFCEDRKLAANALGVDPKELGIPEKQEFGGIPRMTKSSGMDGPK